ncbi:hypothetical protein KEJ27_10375 [Candidatus Bathyarchaeota archaeon]|nr:hypothetical protein [Candidatus Bathyarchaeota archaeon]
MNDRLRLMARAVKVFGIRNYTALAKATGLSVQNVRYNVRRQLLDRGLRVQVHVDHGKLGLARYRLTCRFANSCEDLNVRLLEQLASSGYLEYYGRLLPKGDYLAWLGIPPSFEVRYKVFLDRLVEAGIFKWYTMSRVGWIRYFSMREDCYDFKSGVWRFSWDCLSNREVEDVSVEEDVVSKPRLDMLDLYITASLQEDASTPIPKLASRLGVHYKRLLYHFRMHVLNGGLLKRWILKWQGGLEGTHSLAYLIFWIGNLSGGELEDAKTVFSRIPFICFDTYEYEGGLYMAYITAPMNQLQQCLIYVWRCLPDIRTRLSYALIDPKCSKAFAIPLELYQSGRGWVFNVEDVFKNVSHMLMSPEKNGRGVG